MMKHFGITFASALLLLSACHQTRIVPIAAPRNGQTRLDTKGHSKSYILGYFEGSSFQADCRDGVESIRIAKGPLDSGIQVLIGGIFSTRSVEVECVRPHLDVAGLESGRTVRLQGVYFDSNSSRLQGDSYLVLDELAAYLNDHQDRDIQLSGHTDLNGADIENERLSLARANSGKEYLVSKGIAGRRIAIEGKGSKSPVARALDEDSSALNRRIEIALRKPPAEPITPAVTATPAVREETRRPASGEALIEMLDGTTLRGIVTNQSREQVQVNINGQFLLIPKDRIRRIQYVR